MSRITENMMEWAMYRPFLEELVRGDAIKNRAAAGVTKKVLADDGFELLSEKQREPFKTQVRNKFSRLNCKNCG